MDRIRTLHGGRARLHRVQHRHDRVRYTVIHRVALPLHRRLAPLLINDLDATHDKKLGRPRWLELLVCSILACTVVLVRKGIVVPVRRFRFGDLCR